MFTANSLKRAAAALAVAGFVWGGGGAPAAAAPPGPGKNQSAAAIDPAVVTGLTAIGKYLAGLTRFEFTADTTIETVLRGGHQVEIGGTVHYFVQFPGHVRVDSETDTVKRQYFLDGKTFTIVAPAEGYYGQVPAKPTIRDTLIDAAQTLDVELPLADLYEWSDPATALKPFHRGFAVGTAKVDGVATDHYVLLGRNVDVEFWVQQGDTPLPLKIALVDHRVHGSPRFSARLKWVTAPTFGDDVFTFTPGKEVVRIEVLKPEATTGKGGK